MNLLAAKYLAVDLIKKHYLTGWGFKFNNSKNILGICKYRSCTIEMSRFYVVNNSESQVEQTILHEIAHALAGSAAGHGHQWRIVAQQIGVKNPSRTTTITEQHIEVLKQVANYVMNCPTCGPIGYRHRMGKQMRKGRYSCQKCHTSGLQWEASSR